MTRYLVIAALLGLLVLPVVAVGEETTIPPDLNWTSTPLAEAGSDTSQWHGKTSHRWMHCWCIGNA